MPTTSIKISQLDPIASLTGSDFFPIDQSSSIKTYRASLTQLQNLFSTGSFTGSFTGSILGIGTSPQFVGTSSWAISSSRSISSSYSDFTNSSSYALSSSNVLTASYALNANAGDLSGGGTLNYIPLWTGNKTLGISNIYYGTPIFGYPGYVSNNNFYVQKDTPILYITGSGQGSLSVVSSYNSAIALRSATTSSDAHTFVVGADGGMPGTDSRGVFDWSSYSGSNNLASRQGNDPTGNGQLRLLRIKSNGWYFWPLYGVQSISRDGTFNIGVDSGTENHDARLKIFVYSGSSVSNPVVNHIRKAIEVTYGSGSEVTTFCVSSSGQVIATGYSGSNFNAVSFYGSASYALSSSNAVTASYALTASYVASSDRVPVFATTSSNAPGYVNALISFALPSGYTYWEEFEFNSVHSVNSTGGSGTDTVICTLSYEDGTLFNTSSNNGAGNSGQSFSMDVTNDGISHDGISARWHMTGIITGSKNTSNPLKLKSLVVHSNSPTAVSSSYIYGKVYAKK